MSLRRVGAVARSQIMELSRRRLSIALLLGLPLVFYWAAWDDRVAISFVSVGVGWSVAIVSLFLSHSMTAITPRLALIGYRPGELVVGRVLSVLTFATVVVTALWLYLRTDPVVTSDRYLAISLALSVIGSASIGLAVGAAIRREMEAMLVLIGVVAITLVINSRSLVAKLLPMYAADQYAWAASEDFLDGAQPWRWSLSVAVIAGVIAVVATLRQAPRIDRSSS